MTDHPSSMRNLSSERSNRRVFLKKTAGLALGAAFLSQAPSMVDAQSQTVFGIVGDYGNNSGPQRRVANLISSWNPAFVGTTGDNVYSGAAAQSFQVLQTKVGNYYGRFVNDGTFFPSLGNHDWGDPGTPLLNCDMNGCWGGWKDYFSLPGNGRYYDVRSGNVHLFVLDDYYLEPDGNSASSLQATWLRNTVAASDAPWKIVVHHFSAFGSFGQFKMFRWPFQQWGIDAVFSGHHHAYERLNVGGIPYITTGTGGAGLSGKPGWTHPDSKAMIVKRYGAMRGRATGTTMTLEMIDVDGVVRDRVDLTKAGAGNGNGNGGGGQPAPLPVYDGGIPVLNKRGPTTFITSPTQDQLTGRAPRIEGWALAPRGVSHVDLVIRNTATNEYWNESTRALQNTFYRNRVAVKAVGDQVTIWSYRNAGRALPIGDYVARAWTKSVNGNGDPFGTAIVDFKAR